MVTLSKEEFQMLLDGFTISRMISGEIVDIQLGKECAENDHQRET